VHRIISEYTGQKIAPEPLLSRRRTHRVVGRREMRILKLTLAGMLALSTPIAAHAHHLGSNHTAANTTPVIVQHGNK